MNEELKIGMDSPQKVATAILDALRHERSETLLGAPERLFAKINGVLPGIVDRSLRKQLAVIRRYAQLRDDKTARTPLSTNVQEQMQ